MVSRVVAVVVGVGVMLGSWAPSAWAQDSADGRPSAAGRGAPAVDVSRLPIDLERIHRGLRESEVREERDGLNIRYIVDVYAQAPRLELFTSEDNLVYGPVPYGAPTHKEILEHLTPQEFRAPAADLTALLRWLAERAKK